VIVNNKQKILHVFKTASPISFGGVEDVIDNIISTTNKSFDHTVLCTCGEKNFVSVKGSHTLVAFKYSLIFSNNPVSFGFHKYLFLNSHKYDLIHFHFPYPMMDFHYFTKTPYIVTYHADLLRSKFITLPYRWLAKRFLKRAKCVVYTSKKYAKFSSFKQYVRNTQIIPLTASAESEASIENNYQDKDYFIYVGSFRKYKDLNTLILAAIDADIDLVLVGGGEVEDELKRLVASHATSKIKFAGNVTEKLKFELLSKARALVLPANSESEAFGIVLLEAATLGKPIVTANLNSGTTEINEHNVNGMIFERSNVQSLAVILKALQNDDALCDRLGYQNRQKYSQKYTRKLFGDRHLKLYQKVINLDT